MPDLSGNFRGWVVAQHPNLAADPFVQKYSAELTWSAKIMHCVTADLRIRDDVAIRGASELHQSAGNLPAAIWAVEYAGPTHEALSLADHYSCADRHQDVVNVTNGVTNEGDATALLFVRRG